MNLVWMVALGAFALAVLGVHFMQFVSALCPRKGTLEWIAMEDQKAFSSGCKQALYDAKDLLPMLLTALLSALICAAFVLRELPLASYLLADAFGKIQLWTYAIVCPIMAVLAAYCASKRIAANTAIAAMVAVLTAMDVSSDPVMLAMWMLSFAFFMRWWGSAHTRGANWNLVVLGAFLALGSYFAPSTALFAALLLAAVVFGCMVFRYRFGRGLLSVFVLIASFFGWYALICVPEMMLKTGLAFPQMLFGAQFWTALVQSVGQQLLQMQFVFLPLLDRSCFALQCYGVFALIATLYAAVTRRSYDGFVLAWISAGCMVLNLFDLAPASMFALVVLGYVWKFFFLRAKRNAACTFFTAIAVVTFAADLTLFIFM